MLSYSCIYQIRNLINNKIYIGSSVNFNQRKVSHFNSLKGNYHPNKKIQNAFNKHNEENFIFEILEYVDNRDMLIEREQHYIDTLKPWYNISPTAGNNLGLRYNLSEQTKLNMSKPRSEKHKLAMSESHIGIRLKDKTKEKISNSMKGHITSEETKIKISLANKSRQFSEEHKRKISESKKRKKDVN